MVSVTNCILASIAAIALSASTANAHGELTSPKPTFKGYGGGVASTIEATVLTVPAGMSFSAGPDTNAEAFDTAFKKTGQSLKDFILKNQNTAGATSPTLSAACGFSDPAGTPQALPDKLQWGSSFIHPGPCEAWCDNEIVVPYTANCWKTFADGSVPYSKAKCAGKKQLTFYWLALHSPPWQVYINCVPLSGASSAGGSSATTPSVTTKAPASTTKAPASTTKAPANNSPKTPAATTKAPVASDATPAPAATTKAPGKKCNRKLKVIEETRWRPPPFFYIRCDGAAALLPTRPRPHFRIRVAAANKSSSSPHIHTTPAAMMTLRHGIVAGLAALVLALASTSVHAHGNLVRPQPTFSGYGGGYPSIIQTAKLKAEQSFVGAPDTNAASFDAAFKAAGKSSLKDFILANQDTSQGSAKGLSPACGFSNPNGTPQPLPDTLQWGTGFIHPGPCEAYCDNEIVVPYTANCWKTFASGAVPYSKAKCAGKKQLTFYWLAVHGPPWQVYINCVPLSGGGSGGGGSSGVAAEASTGGNSGAAAGGTTGGNASNGGTANSGNNKNTGTSGGASSSTTKNSNNGANSGGATTTKPNNNWSNMGFGWLNNNNNNNNNGGGGGGNTGSTSKKNLR